MTGRTYGVLEGQEEYVRAKQGGYEFTNHGKWWHWRYKRDQINPEDRAKLEAQYPGVEYFIWSLNTYTGEFIITPCTDLVGWIEQARGVAARNP